MRESRSVVRWLVGLVHEVLVLYGRLGGSQFAAAISYRALFSLVPLATFLASILAWMLVSDRVDQQDIVSAIAAQLGLSSQGIARLNTLIDSVPSPWSLAGLVTLSLALWGATGVMNAMQKTLAVIFDDGASRSLLRRGAVSGLLVFGAIDVILCGVAVSLLAHFTDTVSQSLGEALGWQPFGFGILLGVVVPTVLIFAVFVLLYRYLPIRRPGWRSALAGGAAAAVGFQAVQAGLGWYLSGPADFTAVYASASAIFVFLFSVYLSAIAFVVCAILTCALDQRLGGGHAADGGDAFPAKLPLAEFAFPGPLRERLVAAIMNGLKTTTTGLYEEYLRAGRALEEVGSQALVIASDGRPVAMIETTAIELRRLSDVGLQFAIDEGEGFETLEAWREAHVRFFTSEEMVAALGEPSVAIDDDTILVCETFRLVQVVG
ncbi:MAG: ASCH domain-containing protein [Thermoleophilia bacterium]|nr:ASCH domain-containing protein [Thermoleophilia bacterium]